MNPGEQKVIPTSPPPRRSVRWWMLLIAGVAVVAVLIVGVLLAGPIRGMAGRVLALAGDQRDTVDDQAQGWWTCGMHPWVVLPSPEGGCPICGMDLVPLDPDKFGGGLSIDPVMVQNIGVRLGEVTTGPLKREVRTVGNVVVDETRLADVNTRFSGFIEKLYIDETGEQVTEGEPLFTVYSPELYAAADEYRLAVSNATNAAEGSVQRDVLDAAKRRLELLGLSENEIARLSDEEGQTITLRSPAGGTVLEKMAVAGMRIEPGMRLYRIADLSTVWVEAAVYEDDLPSIAEGQPATVTLPNRPGQIFEGTVAFVSPTINPRTRQATVRIELENENGPGGSRLLMPGMFASVLIDTGTGGDVVLVPREAVLDTGRRQVAMVSLGNGRFEPREITLGTDAGDGMVQVLDGLEPGDKVVTSGQFLLDSEARVRDALAKMLQGDSAATQAATLKTAKAQTTALPAQAAEPLNEVLRIYLAMSDALSRDTIDGLPALADELAESAGRLAPELPSLDAPALSAAAADVRNAGSDLSAARLAFAKVSHEIVPMLRETGVPATFNGGTVEALRCPMYPPSEKTPWLQFAGESRNPYMGTAMPGCFEQDTRVQLPTTPVAEGGTP